MDQQLLALKAFEGPKRICSAMLGVHRERRYHTLVTSVEKKTRRVERQGKKKIDVTDGGPGGQKSIQ